MIFRIPLSKEGTELKEQGGMRWASALVSGASSLWLLGSPYVCGAKGLACGRVNSVYGGAGWPAVYERVSADMGALLSKARGC